MPRILLTTVCRPLGGPDQGPTMGVDVMKGQLCVNQGAFRTSGVGLSYGLEYLAANIDSPTVVLHWPSEAELVRELRRGRFDYVGVSYVAHHFPKMVETVALVRRHAPRARVVLGGYGTVLPQSAEHGDHVCEGEGVAFLRALLGEKEGAPLAHPILVYGNEVFSLPIRAGRKAVVVTGLGCVNGCDFCSTSHKFRRRYLPFVEDGASLFRVMDHIHRRTGVTEFQVLDENFLAQPKRAADLADACEAAGRTFEFFTFASVAALATFSVEELIRIGVSSVWIGFEGKKAGYDKLHGERVVALVRRLKDAGILVCGSMIVGFDYQTPGVIRDELDEILEAGPTYLQCLMYGPSPGTPLHERMEREGRWLHGAGPGEGLPWGRCDGWELTFRHPHIAPDEMAALQRECYDRDLHTQGHSLFRALETWHTGYRNLNGSPRPHLQARADLYARKLREARCLLPVGLAHAPNDPVRRRMEALHRALRDDFGPPTPRERLLERAVLPAAAAWTGFKLRHDLFQEPRLVRRGYRWPT